MQLNVKQTYQDSDTVLNCMHIPAGFKVGKHSHPYDHFSTLVSGKVKVTIGGNEIKELEGFQVIHIEKYKTHVIEALEDSIWMCIHSKPAMNDADQLKLVGT